MTRFYTIVSYDVSDGQEPLVENFYIDAPDMLFATRLIGVYLKGRFEASGRGGEINLVSSTKPRGETFRGL